MQVSGKWPCVFGIQPQSYKLNGFYQNLNVFTANKTFVYVHFFGSSIKFYIDMLPFARQSGCVFISYVFIPTVMVQHATTRFCAVDQHDVLNLKTGAFKKYFPSQETPNGLDGSSSYAIFKDRSEQIWVASMSSIHLYNKEKDNFTCIKTLNALTIDIDQDNKGNLWFSTQGKGLFKYQPEKRIWKKFTRQSIYALLKAVCERFQPFINQRGAKLEVNYPNEEFTAIIDSEAITKLVSNLLTNASKYTKDQVILTCTVQPAQQTFTIQVTDNGIGISEEDQKKIFNPFFQATDNKPGTGIGLSIVKNIVELHKGQIQVESEKGKGSSFTVTLPIEQAEEQEEDIPSKEMNTLPTILQETIVESPARPTTKSKPVMLIVDDNQEMLNFLANNFTNRYNILLAEDGIEALEKLKENDVTLIISDWMMPHMNGVEFCKAVRANPATSHIPFILLTAKTDVDSKIEGLDCQADAYIEKPFSVQYLEACIKNLITMRNLLRQKFSKMPLVPLNSIANNKIDNQFLTQLNEIIEANFSNPELSVDFLAEKLCISRSGLFAKIKTLANITPNELIQLVRLKKAASLLAENKYRINEICYMVGFNNPSYFTKCFQKQFGMKPGEFINNSSKDILPDILGNQQ